MTAEHILQCATAQPRFHCIVKSIQQASANPSIVVKNTSNRKRRRGNDTGIKKKSVPKATNIEAFTSFGIANGSAVTPTSTLHRQVEINQELFSSEEDIC